MGWKNGGVIRSMQPMRRRVDRIRHRLDSYSKPRRQKGGTQCPSSSLWRTTGPCARGRRGGLRTPVRRENGWTWATWLDSTLYRDTQNGVQCGHFLSAPAPTIIGSDDIYTYPLFFNEAQELSRAESERPLFALETRRTPPFTTFVSPCWEFCGASSDSTNTKIL